MVVPPNFWISIAQIIFLASVAFIAYVYLGYPIVMFLLSHLFPQPVRRTMITPRISMIIAARNEEDSIAMKLENALSLDYPKDKFEIIVASDASTDRTDEIVRSFGNQGVILDRRQERQGKTRAQHQAVSVSTGEILIFSDATTVYEPDVIIRIVRNFADPTVGCVAGQLTYIDRRLSAVGKGCRSYWGYEKLLKRWESTFNSLIGVSGCLYAVRRSCHAKLAKDMIDDFVIATEIHLQGLRTVYEPEAISMEDTNHRAKDELRMRVRVIEQTMSALRRYGKALHLREHGVYAFQLICHKILRYVVPPFLFTALVANWFAWQANNIFKYTFITQTIIYFTAIFGWIGDRLKLKLGPIAIPYYFTLVNIATVLAFIRFMRGEAHVVWEPVREKSQKPPKKSESFSEVHT